MTTETRAAAYGVKIRSALADGLQRAAELYREYVTEGGTMHELITHGGCHQAGLHVLDGIASGRVLIGVYELQDAALIGRVRRLLPEYQKTAMESGVDVWTSDSVLTVQLDKLQPIQRDQVFDGDHLRDVAAQRAWIEAQKTRAQIKVAALPKSDAQIKVTLDANGDLLVHIDGKVASRTKRKLLMQMIAEVA